MIDDGIKGCRIFQTKTITLENDLGEEFVERTRKRTSANCTMVSHGLLLKSPWVSTSSPGT